MCKRLGEPLEGLEFFEGLYTDEEFCKELGKAILAAGRLEATLSASLRVSVGDESIRKATLGRLIRYCKNHELLEPMVPHLEMLNAQRNYLAHNIYALFTGAVGETLLPRENLLDSDIDLFTEKAWQLAENLNALADIVVRNYENT